MERSSTRNHENATADPSPAAQDDTLRREERNIFTADLKSPRRLQDDKSEVVQRMNSEGRSFDRTSQFKMRTDYLRFNGAVERDPAIDVWMKEHGGELGAIAREWFDAMRRCGDEVRELLHDGCPVACLGDAPFGYVNAFTSHVNVGFFHGNALPDPARLLQGAGKCMRHVKLRPGAGIDAAALGKLIDVAYADIKARVENG